MSKNHITLLSFLISISIEFKFSLSSLVWLKKNKVRPKNCLNRTSISLTLLLFWRQLDKFDLEKSPADFSDCWIQLPPINYILSVVLVIVRAVFHTCWHLVFGLDVALRGSAISRPLLLLTFLRPIRAERT